MRIRWASVIRGLLQAAFWIWVAAVSPLVWGAEFYSWIDSSGTWVLKDDAGRLPSSLPRTAIWMHRFEDLPAAAVAGRSSATDGTPEQGQHDSAPFGENGKPAQAATPGHDNRTDLQGQMESPDNQLALGQALRLGVPLIGSGRPGQGLPLGLTVIPPGPGGLDQRLRELQALQARSFSHQPISHAPSGSRQASAGQGHR
ncbi:MAG: hypothetical protein ACKOCD_10910 [Nitrospiraceae bacterium]